MTPKTSLAGLPQDVRNRLEKVTFSEFRFENYENSSHIAGAIRFFAESLLKVSNIIGKFTSLAHVCQSPRVSGS